MGRYESSPTENHILFDVAKRSFNIPNIGFQAHRNLTPGDNSSGLEKRQKSLTEEVNHLSLYKRSGYNACAKEKKGSSKNRYL